MADRTDCAEEAGGLTTAGGDTVVNAHPEGGPRDAPEDAATAGRVPLDSVPIALPFGQLSLACEGQPWAPLTSGLAAGVLPTSQSLAAQVSTIVLTEGATWLPHYVPALQMPELLAPVCVV
mmetsp:Transcript_45437/g.145826  ORF Transcript_45437/g.145826 Transcript_45437/m.145826 type:complete len:121 (+) Transcript_45437:362-724(+)